MARRRSHTNLNVYTPPRPQFPVNVRTYVRPLNLRLVEDRRQFHPDGPHRAPIATRRFATRLVERPPLNPTSRYKPTFPSLNVGFAVPEKVARCVRRKSRREVMFATRQTGKGARSRRHRDFWSNVRC